MPITTEVYRRETPQGADTMIVMASIDDEGAEILCRAKTRRMACDLRLV
jgi:hypothetical protein